MTNNIICLMGPTSIGKTRLSIALSNKYPCEIISVDSAKIYKDMNIGTAKPSEKLLNQYPHHLIDIISPTERYSVADFIYDLKNILQKIILRGNIPLLVGGTSMYFNTLKYGLSMLPGGDDNIRSFVQSLCERKGYSEIHTEIIRQFPNINNTIKQQDLQRIKRFLEVYLLTGCNYLDIPLQNKLSGYNLHEFAIIPQDRAKMRKNIELRFKRMLKLGLVEEVQFLWDKYDLNFNTPAIRSVGYRQISEFLHNKYNYSEMVEKSIFSTNQLAKRQLTWLRNWKGLQTLPLDEDESIEIISRVINNNFF